MRRFVDIESTFVGQPPRLGAILARIDVGRGREELYRDQVPELLRSLANQTRVESISASSAIEGVIVDPSRVGKLIDGDQPIRFRDRNEQEFAGYRDAIEAIVRTEPPERMSVPLILSIHRDLFRYTQARGGYLKTDDNRIVSRDEQGMRVVLFEPPPWQETEFLLSELVVRYNDALDHELRIRSSWPAPSSSISSQSIPSPAATVVSRVFSPHKPCWSEATACRAM